MLLLTTILLTSLTISSAGKKKTCDCDAFSASDFTGASLNFQGHSLANAELVNATFGDISHLNVESLGILSLRDNAIGSGLRLATVSSDGGLTTTRSMRLDGDVLKLPALASFSPSGLQVRSDLDMNDNMIRNFEIEPETELRQISIADSILQDVAIQNATATDLTLEDVVVESLVVTSLATGNDQQGAIVGVGAEGELVAQDAILIDYDTLSINRNIQVEGSIDMHNHSIENAVLTSGAIKGNSIDVHVHSVSAESITLLNEQGGDDAICLVDGEGKLKKTSIVLDDDGWMRDAKVAGTINFRGTPYEDEASGRLIQQQGRILDAHIEGGHLDAVESMTVVQDATIGGTLSVQNDVWIHGGLTVSGSVLGSGPYIDMSDARLKENVQEIGGGAVADALVGLRAVSYELHDPRVTSKNDNDVAATLIAMGMVPPPPERQIGFIAQEVEAIFPELVSIDKDGYKGVQYARFVPLLVEAMKELREENAGLRHAIDVVEERIANIEGAAHAK